MNRHRKGFAAALAIIVIAVAAVLGGTWLIKNKRFGAGTAAPPGASSTSTSSAPSSTSEAAGTDDTTGKYSGVIKSAYSQNGRRYLVIDYVDFLTGEAARQAMIEDGRCVYDDCEPPDGYYIRNRNPRLRTFEISPVATVQMAQYWAGSPVDSSDLQRFLKQSSPSLAVFEGIWTGATKTSPFGDPVDFFRKSTYWITLKDNIVTKIEEQYVP